MAMLEEAEIFPSVSASTHFPLQGTGISTLHICKLFNQLDQPNGGAIGPISN